MWPVFVLALLAQPNYASARGGAEPVKNLGRFLEQYLGECESEDPSFNKSACEATAKKVQDSYRDQTLRLELEEVGDQFHLAQWDAPKNAFRVHLTPLFSERALALSVGRPTRLNDDGLPVMKNLPVWVKIPKDTPEFVFRRELERGQVRLELLFKPKGPWRLKRKGDTDIRGAEVALVGLRLYRGDTVIAEQTY